jgi:uncharacterized protein DUF3800
MHILYVDHSGDPDDPTRHFVVGGLAIHEADVEGFRRRLNDVLHEHLDEHVRGIELHWQSIRVSKGPWGRIPRHVKESLLQEVPRLLGSYASPNGFGLFAVARAPLSVPGVDPLRRSFEELLLRFHESLRRLSRLQGTRHHGIVVIDEAKYESILQPVVEHWRQSGTRFGRLHQLVEVPLFADSKATRFIQMADLVAHAVYRAYEHDDHALIGPLLHGFDTDAGVLHGLVHLVDRYRSCPCPACSSRAIATRLRRARLAGRLGVVRPAS